MLRSTEPSQQKGVSSRDSRAPPLEYGSLWTHASPSPALDHLAPSSTFFQVPEWVGTVAEPVGERDLLIRTGGSFSPSRGPRAVGALPKAVDAWEECPR
jgi:hypothetical protein